MMYEYFELGLCDKLSISPHQLTKTARDTLKLAYTAAPSTYQFNQEQPDEEEGVPWGKMALMALLAGGGAYAHGRWANNSPLKDFSKGIDTNLVTPTVNKFNQIFRPNVYNSAVDEQANLIRQKANEASNNATFNGITSKSQLQGTDYYQPDKVEQIAEPASLLAGGTLLGNLGAKAIGGISSRIAPNLSARLGGTALGVGTKALGRGISRFVPGLGSVIAFHDSKQLGDKYVDWSANKFLTDADRSPNNPWKPMLDLRNTVMKGAITAGGTALGATGYGGLVPMVANQKFNYNNQNNILKNQTTARAGVLQNEFQNALNTKQQTGNNIPLNGWFKTQKNPGQLDMTVGQFSSPDLQKQVAKYRPL